jgi:predicted 3-demethylubiquinone-9 3-methyltransferase (glyoxalase superfamily)
MQLLVPSLMFVDQCGKPEEAIELYVSAFEGSRVVHVEYFRAENEGEAGIKQAASRSPAVRSWQWAVRGHTSSP